MIKPVFPFHLTRALRIRVAAAAGACALLLGAAMASAQVTITIQPLSEAASKDTKIFTHDSGVGSGSNLSITSIDIGEHQLALVQFDLSSLTAVNANDITSAVLRLYSTGLGTTPGSTGGPITVSPILDAWKELSTDPGTAPLASYPAFFGGTNPDTFEHFDPTLHFGSAVDSKTITVAGFVTFDITSLVKAWVNGSQANDGVIIQAGSTGMTVSVGFADVDSSVATIADSPPALVVQAVPEPSAMVLSLLGLAGVIALRRRRGPVLS